MRVASSGAGRPCLRLQVGQRLFETLTVALGSRLQLVELGRDRLVTRDRALRLVALILDALLCSAARGSAHVVSRWGGPESGCDRSVWWWALWGALCPVQLRKGPNGAVPITVRIMPIRVPIMPIRAQIMQITVRIMPKRVPMMQIRVRIMPI